MYKFDKNILCIPQIIKQKAQHKGDIWDSH